MERLENELDPNEMHVRTMWSMYEEIGPDTSKEEKDRIIRDMKALELAHEEEMGSTDYYDASIFWGVFGDEHKFDSEWTAAADCYRKEIKYMEKVVIQSDIVSAGTVRALTSLLFVLGMDTGKKDEAFYEEMSKTWLYAYHLVEEGWNDDALQELEDLYWLVRRKELFSVGLNVALVRMDEEAALAVAHEFLMHDADIPEGDDWYEVYSEVLEMALVEMKLADKEEDYDALIDGLEWLDNNSKAILEHAGDIEYIHIPHLVHFFTSAAKMWTKVENRDRTDEMLMNGLEISKELYRDGETLTFDGLKSHMELYRQLSDRHRELGERDESYALELEIRSMLSRMVPDIEDEDIIHERISNGMYLGAFSEELEKYDEMLDYWTGVLRNLVEGQDSEFGPAIYEVLVDHWKEVNDRDYDPDKKALFEEVLDEATSKFGNE